MVDQLSVPWIFWTPLVVTSVAALCTHLYVPESPVRAKSRLDFLGGGLLALGLGAVLLAISQGNAWGWGSPRVVGLFALGVAVLVTFVAAELRVARPMVDMAVMRSRSVFTTNLTAFLVGVAMFGSYILIPELAQLPKSTGFGLGASVTESGLLMLPSAFVMLFSGPISGQLGHRYGSRLPLSLGALVSSASYAVLALAHTTHLEIMVGTALLGIGIGLAFAAMANLIVEAVPQEQTGVATGINTIMRSIGGAVGAQVAAAIVTGSIVHGHPGESGFVGAFTMSGVGALVAMGVTFAIPRRSRRATAETASRPATARA
jgi:predicted MFS family arabinose efflux permease